MKKISVLAVCFIVTFTSHLYAACTVTRGKIEVSQGQGATCSSIQSAINAADGVNPTVIYVMPGTYNEDISLKSNINLQGAGKGVTTINGLASNNGAVTIDGTIDSKNNITIAGFSIRNDGHGIVLKNASNVTITENNIAIIWSQGSGILIADSNNPWSHDVLISNNIIDGFGDNGMRFESTGSGMVIRGNVVKNNAHVGIYPRYTNVIIENNIVSDNQYGIMCDTNPSYLTNKCVVRGNYVSGNTNWGIYAAGSRPIYISNNTAINNFLDMYLQGSTSTNVSFNLFDSLTGTKGTDWVGNFNTKSDGTAW